MGAQGRLGRRSQAGGFCLPDHLAEVRKVLRNEVAASRCHIRLGRDRERRRMIFPGHRLDSTFCLVPLPCCGRYFRISRLYYVLNWAIIQRTWEAAKCALEKMFDFPHCIRHPRYVPGLPVER